MLTLLHIENYALIEHLEISPDASLNIITGETGAGKSIMLGALGLLMGKRADMKALFDEEKKCFVEATFDVSKMNLQSLFEVHDLDYDNACTIRREIAPSGKSRAFINDTPVTLDVLKEISEKLIDVHSQHDSIMLGSAAYQLALIDAFASTETLLTVYQQDYKAFKKAKAELQKLEAQASAAQKEFDYNSFLLEELNKANLKIGEREELDNQLTLLENAEEVKLKLSNVSTLLSHPEQSVLGALQDAVVLMNAAAKFSGEFEEMRKRLLSAKLELDDLASDIAAKEDKIEYDPEEIERVKDRLDMIFRLEQKHAARGEEELLSIQKELHQKVEEVLNFEDNLKALTQKVGDLEHKALASAKKLSEKRAASKEGLAKEITRLLVILGIPNATFTIDQQQKELSADGIDDVLFLYSGNKGFAQQEIKKVASGGEFSRLMLALKYVLAQKTAMPTLIFDEVDTGISGEVAVKMGELMRTMSQKLQIIAITHLHQIAGKGTSHFFVYKKDTATRTISHIKKLTEDERILEIAKMIGGENPTDNAIQSAIELISKN